ncbi:hypothetical protein QQ045_000925 [Rhodiola kirilowii]
MVATNNLETTSIDDESCTFVSVSGKNYWIPKCPVEIKPVVGMLFPDLDQAILFYKEYARIAGFVVRLATSNMSDGVVTRKYLVCQREGFREKCKKVDTTKSDHTTRSRRETRCGCEARLLVNITDGGRYHVYSFEESHNHYLKSDIGKQFLSSHRAMSLVDKKLIMECGKVRIGASKAYHIRKELCGGFMNVRATATDYKNFKRDLKFHIGLNDAQMVVDRLSDKKKTCHGYSFEYFSDGEGTLSRLFWSDGISKRDNNIFGDVVSFDATYRMNKYNLVFVPFTGVDNQLRSVTLATGLISMEDVDSYTWLLTCFKTMLEHEPSVIVTDQDASMKSTIATIFPLSRHRFCMWHITEKLQAKVGISICRETGFLKSIKAVIWGEYNDHHEFEVAWCELINKYDLHANKWLADMYDLRYIGRFMTLVEFFMGFNSAMDLQRQNRVHLDQESRCYVPTLNSTLNLEKHASETFSFPVFKKFQSEMSDSAYGCAIQSINDSETCRMYIINDALRNNKLFKVTFRENGGSLTCSCMLLESSGYICRHLFKVMFFLRYDKIPNYMVTAKWHTDAARKHNPSMLLVDPVSSNQTREQIMLSSKIWSVLQKPQPADVVVNNPGVSRNKGCGKRIRGPREIAMEKSKKPLRSCGYYNEKGDHDKRTCPKRLVIESRSRVAPSEDVGHSDDAGQEQT